MYDVAVIGGSVAGAATATHLARMGHAVVLVDRAQFPRRKACGEGLFPGGVAELERLGITGDARLESAQIAELRFHAGQATARARFLRPGMGIQRERLDAALLRAATEAGVYTRTGIAATSLQIANGRIMSVMTTAGPIEARAFVAADGAQSRLRRLAGLDAPAVGQRYGVTAHMRDEQGPNGAVDVYFRDGYEIYRTPVGGGRANIAILLDKGAMARFAGQVTESFLAIIGGDPAFSNGIVLEDAPLAAGPFPRGCRRAWRGNLALVGDATGFFDGISGDGMSSSLIGARLCADAVTTFLDTDLYDAFRAYERQRRKVGRSANWLAHVSLAMSRRPAVARFGVKELQRRPATFSRLVAISNGTAPMHSLRPRDLFPSS